MILRRRKKVKVGEDGEVDPGGLMRLKIVESG